MRVIDVNGQPPVSVEKQVLAIGKFDGIHIGHQAILHTARRDLQGASLAVMSFSPHPTYILSGNEEYRRLLTPHPDKVRILGQQGVKTLYEIQFSKAYAATSAEQFVKEHLAPLNLQRVIVGADFRFGQGGKADVQVLKRLCGEIGVPVSIVEQVEENGLKVSSSQIRAHLAAGRVEAAEALLGRPYMISGEVVHGDKIGRTIGFPTANLGKTEEYVLPLSGVYAVSTEIVNKDGASHNWFGVVNAGRRPTVDNHQFRIEVHLLGFSGDIYGETLRISFLRRIRDEQKFSGIEALKMQIAKDCELAKSMLGLGE